MLCICVFHAIFITTINCSSWSKQIVFSVGYELSLFRGFQILQVLYLFAHETTPNPVISGFCLEVDENCAILAFYVTSSDNSLWMFWDDLPVPSLRVSRSPLQRSRILHPWRWDKQFPKMSVRNCHCWQPNSSEDNSCELPTPCTIFSLWGKHQCRTCLILCPVITWPQFFRWWIM